MALYPGNKKFAFSIFDDTDNGTVANLSPVYDLLTRHGIRTTKSVWVYPPRGFFKGDSLQCPDYLRFILDLKNRGFEIALHNVGDGAFSRSEILQGLESFRELIGEYPAIHVNHGANPDNLYWGPDRFVWPMNVVYQALMLLLRRHGRTWSGGSTPDSPFFWGDAAKHHVKFIRNFTFNGINLLRYDPKMPYVDRAKLTHSNYWFSSSDGHTVREMNSLLSQRNLDRLENENGVCIVYTHFASHYVDSAGRVDPEFAERVADVAGRGGWFVPVSGLLNYLLESRGKDYYADYWYLLRLNVIWLGNRIVKRIRFGG
jgi:hypothetical protein